MENKSLITQNQIKDSMVKSALNGSRTWKVTKILNTQISEVYKQGFLRHKSPLRARACQPSADHISSSLQTKVNNHSASLRVMCVDSMSSLHLTLILTLYDYRNPCTNWKTKLKRQSPSIFKRIEKYSQGSIAMEFTRSQTKNVMEKICEELEQMTKTW